MDALITAGFPGDNNLTDVEHIVSVKKQYREIKTNYASIPVDVADNVVARSISVTEGTFINKDAALGFSHQQIIGSLDRHGQTPL